MRFLPTLLTLASGMALSEVADAHGDRGRGCPHCIHAHHADACDFDAGMRPRRRFPQGARRPSDCPCDAPRFPNGPSCDDAACSDHPEEAQTFGSPHDFPNAFHDLQACADEVFDAVRYTMRRSPNYEQVLTPAWELVRTTVCFANTAQNGDPGQRLHDIDVALGNFRNVLSQSSCPPAVERATAVFGESFARASAELGAAAAVPAGEHRETPPFGGGAPVPPGFGAPNSRRQPPFAPRGPETHTHSHENHRAGSHDPTPSESGDSLPAPPTVGPEIVGPTFQ